jgi:hypothetical protein
MTESDFLRLLRFYLACIESEDRRSLSKKVSALHRSLVSPWNTEEPLFHPEAAKVVVELTLRSDHEILLSCTAPLPGSERVFYGYPVFLDEKGFLAPLFLAEVEVEHREGRCFFLRCANVARPQLNRHILLGRSTQEEAQAIVNELEGDYGSFAARLRTALSMVELTPDYFDPACVEPYPRLDEPGNRWINRPILFKADRGTHTDHLRHELLTLAQYPRLFSSLSATAAGALAGVVAPMWSRARTRCGALELLQVLPLNRDQENAAHSGLRAPLTLVTGPPGTGKSQMIVDLLASCALAGRPVLFSSKNNKAVNVVRDRLRTILGPDRDFALRLGSRVAMNASQQELDERLRSLRSDTPPATSTRQALKEVQQEIAIICRRIEDVERGKKEYVRLDQDRRLALNQIDPVWVDSWMQADRPSLSHMDTKPATDIADALDGKCTAGLWLRLQCALAPAAMRRSLRDRLTSITRHLPPRIRADLNAVADEDAGNAAASLAKACEQLAFLTRWRAAEDACERTRLALATEEPAEVLCARLEKLQRRRSELAGDELRGVWTNHVAAKADTIRIALNRYFDLASRESRRPGNSNVHALDQLKGTVRAVSADLPIWIVTNLSVRNALPLAPAFFDLVILDEASQCDIPSALPLLFRAKRMLVVGDPRQLRHVSTLSSVEEENLAIEHGVTAHLAAWSYKERSLYALTAAALLERGQEPLFLSEHYRSHPSIIDFSNRTFYRGRLVIRTPLETLHARLNGEPMGLFWHDIRGASSQSSRSAFNEPELHAVLELLDRWFESGLLRRHTVDFGVVTPFRLQMERLADAICSRPWWPQVRDRLTVGTAHQFQGDERDVMIFSPVVNGGMHSRLVRWVADTDQLLNVALTRARAALHVVGDLRACAASGGFLGDFAAAVTAARPACQLRAR